MTAAAGEVARAMFATAATRERFPKPAPPSAQVTPETIDGFTLVFEGTLCGRCGGKGVIPRYGHVMRGRCFECDGYGARLTKPGNAARARFNQLSAAALPVLREEISEGDRVWCSYRGLGAWCEVTGTVRYDMTKPGDTEPYVNIGIEIAHPLCRGGILQDQSQAGQGYTIPRWDAARIAEIVNEVAAMPGAFLQPAETAGG
jgi:hypothetical protein